MVILYAHWPRVALSNIWWSKIALIVNKYKTEHVENSEKRRQNNSIDDNGNTRL